MRTSSIILNNFHNYYLSNPIKQNILNKHLAYMLASAQCVSNKVSSKHLADKIYEEMVFKVQKYGVSPNLIDKRQFNFLPASFYQKEISYQVETESSLIENSTIQSTQQDNSDNFLDLDSMQQKESTKVRNHFPYTHQNLLSNPNGYQINNRMRLYENCIIKLLRRIYMQESDLPGSLVHTTCTGYISPSPAQTFFSQNNWLNTQVIHAYQMGCYGAIPTINIAAGLVSASYHTLAKRITVDVIHSEMSSLNLKITDSSPGHIVNTTLFGDGFIKYSVLHEQELSINKNGLRILAIDSVLIKNSLTDMSLVPGPYSFEIFISKNVPLLIGESIYMFMNRLTEQIGMSFNKSKNNIHYAIHPGGPKILSYIEKQLSLSPDKMKFSKDVFYQNGNMVSATLPHVWRDMITSNEIKSGDKIISVAFGPGLTITGAIFEKI